MFRRVSSIIVIACLWSWGPEAYGSCEVVADLAEKADPTSEQMEWAHSKFIDDGTPYGFDRIRFLRVDFETIIDSVDSKWTTSNEDPAASETGVHTSETLAFALSPFPDHEYFLVVERVQRDTIHGYNFINLFGAVVLSPCEVYKHGLVGNWQLHINASEETGLGEIVSSESLVALKMVPNSDLIVAAEVSKARASTFPPID